MKTFFNEELQTGDLIWAENVKDAPGQCMKAQVIETDLEPGRTIGFWFGDVKSEDCVRIQHIGTPAMPVLNNEPWVTYWPAKYCMITD